MTLSVTIGGTEVATSGLLIVPESGLVDVSSCADGSTGDSLLRVDDPTGALTFTHWDPVIVEESACSQPRCFTGWLYQYKVSRGPYTNGAGRIWELQVVDLNAMLGWRIFHESDAKRPAETGSDRLDWLMTSVGMDGLIFDNGKIMANAWLYDEADYREQTAYDVLNSIISASAVNRWTFFVYWDPSATPGEEVSLFYGDVTTTLYDSTMSISNVAADVTGGAGLVLPPWQDADLTSDGTNIYDGGDVSWEGGRLYRQRTTTFAAYGVHRDGLLQSTRINNAVTASRHMETYLDVHSAPTDTVTCVVRMPRAKVNLIDAGMRMLDRFSHLPGYGTATHLRVARRTFTFAPRRNTHYDVKLTMNLRGINQSGGGGAGGDPGGFPNQPPGPAVHFYSGELSFQSDGYGTAHVTGTGAVIPNTTNTSSDTVAPIFQDGVTYNYTFTIDQTGGDNPPSVGLADMNGAAIGGGHGIPIINGVGSGLFSTTGSFTVTSGDVTNAYAYGFTGALGHPVGGRTTIVTWVVDPVGWDDGTASNPPLPGQEVGVNPPEYVTMTGASGTTAWPFANGSLRVFYDFVEQTAAILTQDGATGAFTMAAAPTNGMQVTVRYQGR